MSELIFPASLKPIVNKGYSQTRGGNIWRSDVLGGLPRQGRDTYYDAVPIGIALVVSALGRQAFWSFITQISGGADSFQMMLDTGMGLEYHNVQITSDISESTDTGVFWNIQFTATTERTSIQEDTEFTQALPDLYGEYVEFLPDFLDIYAQYCTTPNFIFDYMDDPYAPQAPGVTASFINGLYYRNNTQVSFNDLVTFSRLSAGSYIEGGVLKIAAAGVARSATYGYDSDGVLRTIGLLLENTATNLIPYSHPAPAAILSGPDTTATAVSDSRAILGEMLYSISGDAYVAVGVGTGNVTLQAGTYCFSLYSTSDSPIGMYLCDSYVYKTSTVIKATSGMFRHYTVFTLTTESVTNMHIKKANAHLVSGFMLESGNYPTSYIPTTGTAATRAADSASVLMQDHTAGTIFSEFLSDAVAIDRAIYTAGAITLKRLATGAVSVTAGAVTVTSAVVPSGSVKSAISYDGATLKLAVNGVVYSAASALPSAGTSLVLGASTFANVWQRSEAYDNALLIEVTQ